MKQMKKGLVLLLPICLLLGTLAFAAADEDDPLISLSFLQGEFLDRIFDAADRRLDRSDEALLEELEASGGELTVEQSAAPSWRETRLKSGDALLGQTGTFAMLHAGGMEVRFESGAVVDVTAGQEVPSGAALSPNHRYMVAEDTAAEFLITSPTAVISYQGPYDFDLSRLPDYNAMARALRTLHLFQGTDTDSGESFALENSATRIQALIMFIRVLGEEEAALAWEGEIPFADVAAWARPYVGYAYEKGYTNGVSPVKFGSNNPATVQQYTEFMLRAMDYSSTATSNISDALLRAWDNGVLTQGETEALGSLTAFTRAEMVYLSYYALFAQLPEGDTLGDLLEEGGIFTAKEWRSATDLVTTDRF